MQQRKYKKKEWDEKKDKKSSDSTCLSATRRKWTRLQSLPRRKEVGLNSKETRPQEWGYCTRRGRLGGGKNSVVEFKLHHVCKQLSGAFIHFAARVYRVWDPDVRLTYKR